MKKISLRGQKILDFKSMQFYMYHFNPKSPYKSNSFRNPLTSRIQSFKWSLGQKIKIPGLNIQENTQKNPGILLGSINIVMMIYSLNPILQKRWKEMNMYWIQEWINKAKFVSVSIFFHSPIFLPERLLLSVLE